MKAIILKDLLEPLYLNMYKTVNPLNATDNIIYLTAILSALVHISEQIEELSNEPRA
jgi:hypothetical protein